MSTRCALVSILTFLGCLILFSGCKPAAPVKQAAAFRPLQNGFGVVAKWVGVDSGPGASLFYKGTNETPVLVWRDIGTHGYPILYTNDIALLMADKPDEQGRLGGGALIAVQGTGPAMDISYDLLHLYSAKSNVDFSVLVRLAYQPLRLQQSDGEMSVTYLTDFNTGDRNGLEFQISWEEVFSIMEDVKRTGRTNKITNKDTLYLQKIYWSRQR